MKKVIFVTPNLANGGAERVTAILANELAEQGMTVEVAFMKDRIRAYQLSRLVITYDFYSERNRISRIVWKILRLRRLMKENVNATFIAMLPFETFYTWMASLGLQNKIVYSLRNDPANMHSMLDHFIKKIVYPGAYKIIFQTEEARIYFPEKIWRKGLVIPNPIDEKLPEKYRGKRKKEIVTVGRLSRQKNLPLLLKAFSEVHKNYPEWKLRIFGQGELKEELTDICRKMDIIEFVDFCGFRKKVTEEINQSGMFVLASDYEGISNAMLEALASGIPCICTDCPVGGARMIIKDHENGILVPVGDKVSLAKAMVELIENPLLADKLSENALLIREKLSAKKIAETWSNIL